MVSLPPAKIESLRAMRRGGMTIRDIEARAGVSRQTVQKYTDGIFDRRLGHAYKAPVVERHTVSRTLSNGTKRSVTADTKERAEEVCSWQSIGSVAAKIVAKTTINHLGPKAEHSTKETGRDGATNTDPALTATTFHGGT